MISNLTKIIQRLPDMRGDPEKIPSDLIGSTIIAFGTAERKLDGSDEEHDDLIIEYRPLNSNSTKRIVLEFDDMGMWTGEVLQRE